MKFEYHNIQIINQESLVVIETIQMDSPVELG